jgi:hypothetical protein
VRLLVHGLELAPTGSRCAQGGESTSGGRPDTTERSIASAICAPAREDGTSTSAAFDWSGRAIVTGGVDGTVRLYACEICGGLDDLVAFAGERLAATGRELTREERKRYLG